ncbi:peptidoglycan DD-metalloendopeptidase family protein [Altererythrobacter indicus]|uniref:Peptidoglycan DD-metalloendopeptidase family protein n=2 Tax=Altericroceibacterium indicum TaxID=374177 RepID=A0A845AHD5_9SPHN|nr:peptidoglycan DD-metalloendopeptidase family protein [Altericroceibacterium indicum]MXP26518.1 peptidoglycan DD-metalloendopeptidase family protein [Altericroceibacterium indicum]
MRDALQRALIQQEAARKRSAGFEEKARNSAAEADKTANRLAALAAEVQQAEAGIAAAEARIALIDRERRQLNATLAERQRPLVQLNAALQQLSRRPVALSVVQPGSVKDMVYMRAILSTALPEIQHKTADLRDEIGRSRNLHQAAEAAAQTLRAQNRNLFEQRQRLTALELQQRQITKTAGSSAEREAERALTLGEKARDLNSLVVDLDRMGTLRRQLAQLPGPLLRPAKPSEARLPEAAKPPQLSADQAAPKLYLLPVNGKLVSGFGVPNATGTSTNITLVPRAKAQIIAPAAGRVAFAGPYKGYGRIVIIEHDGGWTSIITGLGRNSVKVGDTVTAGMPLGAAQNGRSTVSVELRHDGEPVNPLRFIS